MGYIKLFTDINPKDFEELNKATLESPYKREAQMYLAKEITKIVHGENGLNLKKKTKSTLNLTKSTCQK